MADFKSLIAAGRLIVEDCLPSTNSRLKELAMEGAAEGTVLIARRQTGGRGRMERQFVSPEGGLYYSMLLTPTSSPEQSLSLTPCAAVAVHRAIEALCGVSADIKWPNDLMLQGKKICGILCESVFFASQQKLIVGIGINVSTAPEAFGQELADTAASLLSVLGHAPTVDEMAAELTAQLDTVYALWQRDHRAFLKEYRRHCINLGKSVSLIKNGLSRSATALDIDSDYALVVEYPDGEREHIHTGEVSLR